MTNNIAIYVSSYDGCSDIWEIFFDIWERFWGDCCYPIYLINNQKSFSRKNVKLINTGKEISWFYRTIISLEQIHEKYVLFLLEDYFISKNIKNDDILELVQLMDDENLYYCRLSESLIHSKTKKVISVPTGTNYAVSLQPGIWNREYLINLLKKINKESPWDFEFYLNNNLEANGKYYVGVRYDTRDLLGYKNGVLRGKWIPETVKYYSQIGYTIDLGSRELLSNRKWMAYKLALIGKKYIPKVLHKTIKNILISLKIKYV